MRLPLASHQMQRTLYSLFGLLLMLMGVVGAMVLGNMQESVLRSFSAGPQGVVLADRTARQNYHDALLSKTLQRGPAAVLGNGCAVNALQQTGVCGERLTR